MQFIIYCTVYIVQTVKIVGPFSETQEMPTTRRRSNRLKPSDAGPMQTPVKGNTPGQPSGRSARKPETLVLGPKETSPIGIAASDTPTAVATPNVVAETKDAGAEPLPLPTDTPTLERQTTTESSRAGVSPDDVVPSKIIIGVDVVSVIVKLLRIGLPLYKGDGAVLAQSIISGFTEYMDNVGDSLSEKLV